MTEYEMEMKIIQDIFEHEGITLNPSMCTIESILDFMLYWPSDYTIYDWIKDTRENEPCCFM